MANVKKISQPWNETGKTVYAIIRREADGYRLDDADGAFAAAPADPYLTLTEDTVIKGIYENSESRTAWNNGRYSIIAYKQAEGSPAPASDTVIGAGDMYIVSDTEIVLDASVSLTALDNIAEHDATQALVDEKVSGNTFLNVISAINGSLQVDPVADGGIITVYRKTSIAITFNLGKPMIGRKLFFAVRKDVADAAYTIPNGGTTPKEITSTTDLNTGAGYIGLTPTELDIAAGLYTYAEIQSVSNAGGDPVPEQIFQLKVKDHALNL